MLPKSNGKEDTLLVFMQNVKFCFRMLCQTFPPNLRVIRVEASPQGHDTKISRHSASFMVNRTQLKFIDHLFLRLQISSLCMENKVFGITSSLQTIRSFNIMVKEI